MDKAQYRPEIDGLRAIAVLSVLLYHVGAPGFSGGYVGVDVFFVISGYLITRLIKEEIDLTGQFSFSSFYARRIRRLFPALAVTVLAVMAAGALLFSPQHFQRLGSSTISAVFSFSNFFFLSESGYFDTSAELKPLLHTWSLSIEEQFYLLWPLLLLFVIKLRSLAPWVLVAIGAVSLCASVVVLDRNPSGAFFITPLRAYEFVFGAILVWITAERANKWALEALFSIGLGLILFAVFLYDEATSFPGIAAILPCVGTALSIYAGRAPLASQLLRNRVAVGVGLISYSLYLVHWPIFVFYKYYVFRELLPIEQCGIVVAAIGLAILMYRYVETPIRRRRAPKVRAFSTYAVIASLLAFPAGYIYANDGLEWRIPVEIRSAISRMDEKIENTKRYMSDASRPYEDINSTKVLVLGDSHSRDFYNALHLSDYFGDGVEIRRGLLDDQCLYLIGGVSPPAILRPSRRKRCENQYPSFANNKHIKDADYIIHVAKWTDGAYAEYIPYLHEYLSKSAEAKLIIVGRKPDFPNVPDLVMNFGRVFGLDKELYNRRQKKVNEINASVSRVSDALGVEYIDIGGLVCNDHKKTCPALDSDNNLLYWDGHHYTLEGAKFFGDRMVDADILKVVR